jgi:hypothetical protein
MFGTTLLAFTIFHDTSTRHAVIRPLVTVLTFFRYHLPFLLIGMPPSGFEPEFSTETEMMVLYITGTR